jgi:hypothetical protein
MKRDGPWQSRALLRIVARAGRPHLSQEGGCPPLRRGGYPGDFTGRQIKQKGLDSRRQLSSSGF